MSEHGFHVHGPHDHELEHAAHGAHGSFGGRLAVATAILATVGAVFSFRSGGTESEALRLENEASIRRSEAATQWGSVLTTDGQLHMAALAIELVPEAREAHFQAELNRLVAGRDAAKAIAVGLEREAIELDQRSDEQLHRHHRWAQATTVLQIAIAIAAIALLTRRQWMVWGVAALGAAGAAIGAAAWLQL